VATVEKERREAADHPPTPGSSQKPRRGHAAEWQAAYETEITKARYLRTSLTGKGTVKSKMVF
jgi:hypothetical protein